MNLILIEIYQSDEYNFFFSHAVFYVKHFFLEEWLTYYIILVSSVNKHSVFEIFNSVERIMSDVGISCAYDMPSFWCNNRKDYKVIPTKFHKGYMKALEDVEREVRKKFGFSERDNIIFPPPFAERSEE